MTKKENLAALLFIVPSFAGVAVFYIIPFVMSLGYATASTNGSFAGFDNFIDLFNSGAFRLAALNTLKFMVIAIPLNIAFPLSIACLLYDMGGNGWSGRGAGGIGKGRGGIGGSGKSRGAKGGTAKNIVGNGSAAKDRGGNGSTGNSWLKTVFMSPLVIPTACTAFFFRSLFISNGLLSRILGVGTQTDWLQTEFSFPIAVGLYIWKNMGFNLVLALAGLANIPKDYYEWASVEGMGKTRMFFKITLVYLIPALFIMFVMSFINSFKVYRELYMLAGNYPNENIYMLQHYMNNQFARLNYQNLTTAAFVIAAAISIFMVIFFIVDKKAEFGE